MKKIVLLFWAFLPRINLGATIMLAFMVSEVAGDPPFIPNVRVSDDAGATMTINQGESCFALYGENIYAICNLAERSVVPMIPFARSQTGGLTWEPNIPWRDVTAPSQWHSDPVIMSDENGGVHMIIQFSTSVVRHYLSIDGGQTWIDTSNVSDPGTGGRVDKPWGILKNGKIFIVWNESGGSASGFRFARSFDNGATFERFTINPGGGVPSCIDIDNAGVLYVIYGWDNLYFRKSYDDGDYWTAEKFLSNVVYQVGVGDRAPINSLTTYGDGILFLTWVDSREGSWDIFGMRSLDGGNTWSNKFIVNDFTAGGQCKGWAVFDPYGGLHVHYYHTPDWPTTTNSLWCVRYQYSSDSGATFEPSVRETDNVFKAYYYTDNTFMGEYHILQTDSNYVYSIWTDGRDGNMNLYFTRAPLNTGVEESKIIEQPISIEVPSFITRNAVLKISTPRPCNVDISAYDIAGRRILTLFNGRVVQSITIPLNMGSLPKGVIFFRITSDSFIQTYKSINLLH